MLAISITAFFLLLAVGVPVYIAIATGAILIAVFHIHVPLSLAARDIFGNMDSWTFVAIPLFVLAGNLLAMGKTMRHLVDFVDSLVGHLPGGMAIVTIVVSMLFAAMSSSSTASAATLGTILVKPMLDLGYKKSFVLALIATGGTLATLIPPSGIPILYGLITQTSIADLFIAGVIPGIVTGVVLMIMCVIICKRRGYGVHPPATWTRRLNSSWKAIPALMLPVIILGGIYSGILGVVEAAAVSALYALAVSGLIYRELNIQNLQKALKNTLRTSAFIILIIGVALFFSYGLTYAKVPQAITEVTSKFIPNWFVFLIVINALLLFLGCFLESVSITYMIIPIILSSIIAFGINPVHFGVIFTLNMEIGMITPPFGINLYVLSGVTNEPVGTAIRGVLPFIIAMIIALLIITFVPSLSLWLPGTM